MQASSKNENEKPPKKPIIITILAVSALFMAISIVLLIVSFAQAQEASTTLVSLDASSTAMIQSIQDSSMVTSFVVILLLVMVFWGGIMDKFIGVKIQDPVKIRYKNEY